MSDEYRHRPGRRISKGRQDRRLESSFSRRDFVRVLFKRRQAVLSTVIVLFLLASAGFLLFRGWSAGREQNLDQLTGESEQLLLALRVEREALILRYSRQDPQVQEVDRQIRLADQQSRVERAREERRPLPSMAAALGPKLMLLLVLAFGGGIGVAFLLEHLDCSFTTGRELERHLEITHLVSIPEQGE
jgi:hypothetical protein